MKLHALAICFFSILPLLTEAQDNTPKYSNEFLSIGVSARGFGMSGSMVAHVNDASAGYWNPAGLAGLKSNYQLDLMHASYFGGIANYDYGAFAAKTDKSSALGFSVIRFAVDDIADTRLLFDANGSINYDNITFFSAADYGFLMSYARNVKKWGGFSVGGNMKIIRRVVGDFAGSWGFGVDFGLQKSVKNWSMGLVARDIFGTFNSWSINDEELAAVYARTGNELYSKSVEITLPRVVLGMSHLDEFGKKFQLLSSLDLICTTDGQRNALISANPVSIDPALGFELGYQKKAFLRGGVSQFQKIKDFDGSESWSFQPNMGVGFRIQEISLNYAYTDIANQAAGLYSHVFSIMIDFNAE